MTATNCLLPNKVRQTVDRKIARHVRAWALGDEFAPFSVSLRPPSAALVAQDFDRVSDWVTAWQREARSCPDGVEVVFESRKWSSVGTQSVPTKIVVSSAEAAVEFCGRARVAQFSGLRATASRALQWADEHGAVNADSVIRPLLGKLADLEPADFDRLFTVASWLVDHPESEVYIRSLPVAGMDTKWLEQHRGLVTPLVLAATGATSLGLKKREALVRMRLLHDDVRIRVPGGVSLSDLTATADELRGFAPECERVLVIENLETLLALPADGSLGRTVAVYGAGYSAPVVATLPWLDGKRVEYWGDIDSHGFVILNHFRTHCTHAVSVLMDRATLDSHRELTVVEPTPSPTDAEALEKLTEEERALYRHLAEAGHLRLEQERIEWSRVLRELGAQSL